MTNKSPQPVLASQRWVYKFTRPRQMGWPLLTRPTSTGPLKVEPREITVELAAANGGPPKLYQVRCRGRFQPSGRDTGWHSLRCDLSKPNYSRLQLDAPYWVLELAAAALQRVTRTT